MTRLATSPRGMSVMEELMNTAAVSCMSGEFTMMSKADDLFIACPMRLLADGKCPENDMGQAAADNFFLRGMRAPGNLPALQRKVVSVRNS
jgi:hypothetical protein